MPFDNDFQNLIAPYQQAASQFNSNTPMLGQQGMFQRMQMPGFVSHIPFIGDKLSNAFNGMGQGADRALDGAMLGAAMVPEARGPEGAGGGISRALQGVLGAGQYRRQLALQSMMLPYQMMQPRLQAEDTMSQIQQRTGLAAHYKAQDDFYNSRTQHYENMDDARNNPKAIGQSHVDDSGQEWQEIFNPVAGKTRLFSPTSQKYADELAPDQAPSFNNAKRANRNSNITLGNLVGQAYPPANGTQYTPAEAATAAESLAALQAKAAGMKAQQENNVRNPIEEAHKFRDQQLSGADKLLPTAPTETERLGAAAGVGMFRDKVSGYQSQKEQMDRDKAEYHASGVWKNNVGFQSWRDQKNKTQTPEEPATSSAPGPSSRKTDLPF